MSQSSLIMPIIVLITNHFSNSTKFRVIVKIPRQRANSAAQLKIPWPAVKLWALTISVHQREFRKNHKWKTTCIRMRQVKQHKWTTWSLKVARQWVPQRDHILGLFQSFDRCRVDKKSVHQHLLRWLHFSRTVLITTYNIIPIHTGK